MPRRLALIALVLALAGCTRYNSRGQSPFRKDPPPPPNFAQQPGPPVGQSPLALPNSGGITFPGSPGSPLPPDDAALLPPKPPGSGAAGAVIAVPQPPRPPAVADSNVVPAGAVMNADPSLDRRRREPAQPVNPGVITPGSPGTGTPGANASGSPSPPSPAATNLAELKRIAQMATEKWKTVDTYEARLTRREVVGDYKSPTEEVLVQFRKEPMAVYMKNVGEAGKGREVIYNPSKFGDTMHIYTGAGDAPWPMKVTRSPVHPDVMSHSRHSIRDAGFGTTIGKFAGLVEKVEAGKLPPDVLKYVGQVKRPEFGVTPLDAVEQTVRPGEEQLPRGGLRQWFFDARPDSPSRGLPVLVILTESNGTANGREVEYYCFTQVRTPAELTDADFDPARLGKKK